MNESLSPVNGVKKPVHTTIFSGHASTMQSHAQVREIPSSDSEKVILETTITTIVNNESSNSTGQMCEGKHSESTNTSSAQEEQPTP